MNPFFVYVTPGFQLLYQITTSLHLLAGRKPQPCSSSLVAGRINTTGTWWRGSQSSWNALPGFLSLKVANSVALVCRVNLPQRREGKSRSLKALICRILSLWKDFSCLWEPAHNSCFAPKSHPTQTRPGLHKHFDTKPAVIANLQWEHHITSLLLLCGVAWHDHLKPKKSFVFVSLQWKRRKFCFSFPPRYLATRKEDLWAQGKPGLNSRAVLIAMGTSALYWLPSYHAWHLHLGYRKNKELENIIVKIKNLYKGIRKYFFPYNSRITAQPILNKGLASTIRAIALPTSM